MIILAYSTHSILVLQEKIWEVQSAALCLTVVFLPWAQSSRLPPPPPPPEKPHTYLTTFLPSSTARYFNRKEIKGRKREEAWGSSGRKRKRERPWELERSKEHTRWVVALRKKERKSHQHEKMYLLFSFIHTPSLCKSLWSITMIHVKNLKRTPTQSKPLLSFKKNKNKEYELFYQKHFPFLKK